MRVETTREAAFDAIMADSNFVDLVDEVIRHKVVLFFVAGVIKRYTSAADLADGPHGSGLTIDVFAQRFVPTRGVSAAAGRAAQKVGVFLKKLYASHDPAHVRGAIIEGLVERRLATRYSGSLLENNVYLELANGTPYRSSRSLDVFGWDESVGEGHDCKARARQFVSEWTDELQRELVPRTLKVGLVTADSYRPAMDELKRAGVKIPQATLISLEQLWDFAPLQP
jgi:hypothetical protein